MAGISIPCRCLFRRDGCLARCTVSRESRLHERDCSECGFGGGKYKYNANIKSGKIRRKP